MRNQSENRVNSTLALVLGLTPAVCAASTAWNGLTAGLVTVLVFAAAEYLLSLLEKSLPETARFPVLLAAASGLAALLSLLAEAFLPTVYDSIGAYLPLAAAGCLLLDQVPTLKTKEAAPVFGGFLLCLTAAGLLCEFLGAGTLFGAAVLPESMEAASALAKAPGAFLMLAFILMARSAYGAADGKEEAE